MVLHHSWAVRCQFHTSVVKIQSQSSPRGIYGGQSVTGTGCLEYFVSPLPVVVLQLSKFIYLPPHGEIGLLKVIWGFTLIRLLAGLRAAACAHCSYVTEGQTPNIAVHFVLILCGVIAS
jgi:hypothetical protein